MLYSIQYSQEATEHLWHFIEYYNTQVNNLGIEFYGELIEAIESLQYFPEMYQVHYKNRRVLYNLRFKTNVVYVLDHNEKTITILAIIRSETDPSNWKTF